MSLSRSLALLAMAGAAVAQFSSLLAPHGGVLQGVNVQLQYPWTLTKNITSTNNPTYSPGRAPAVPLAVRSPYLQAWSPTSSNGTLNTNGVIFWDGSPLGWEGIVTVDGVHYEWMGVGTDSLPSLKNVKKANAQTVTYDSSYSNFTFTAGPVLLTASFFSPVTPHDTCRQSIPMSYLTVYTQSLDQKAHSVKLYTDVNGAWVTQPSATLVWDIYEKSGSAAFTPVNGTNFTATADSLFSWVVKLEVESPLAEQNGQSDAASSQGVFPLWGNFSFATSQGGAKSLRYQSGWSVNTRFQYLLGNDLTDVDDSQYRPYDVEEPVFAYEHDLGQVGPAGGAPVAFTIGMSVDPGAQYLSSKGLETLAPWWKKCYGDFWTTLNFHWHDRQNATAAAAAFEAKLRHDINSYYGLGSGGVQPKPIGYSASSSFDPQPKYRNGSQTRVVNGTDQFGQQYTFDPSKGYGYLLQQVQCDAIGIAIPFTSEAQSYYAITALSARQVHGATELTVASAVAKNPSEPFLFLKEISSNGNINTIDVIFPTHPYLLWANPALLRYLLAPGYQMQEAGFYPNSYSLHDIGSRFPNATGHTDGGDEPQPLEECGNAVIMALSLYRFTKDLSGLTSYYNLLQKWAQYLIEESRIPALQLSTDDFAGRLANQTNLAIKGIVGLAAMGEIATLVGDSAGAANYTATSQAYYNEWAGNAIAPSRKHTMLAFQWRSSWGLLYNVYPAKLLNLSIIPQSLYDMQSEWYPTVSQVFGVPLDTRHYWTKSDWEMWVAGTTKPSTRRLLVDSLAYWLNQTTSGLPFSDIFQTLDYGEQPADPDPVTFNARSVVGGHFALLALEAAGTK